MQHHMIRSTCTHVFTRKRATPPPPPLHRPPSPVRQAERELAKYKLEMERELTRVRDELAKTTIDMSVLIAQKNDLQMENAELVTALETERADKEEILDAKEALHDQASCARDLRTRAAHVTFARDLRT